MAARVKVPAEALRLASRSDAERLHSSCRFTVSSQCMLSSKCEHRLKMGRKRPGVEDGGVARGAGRVVALLCRACRLMAAGPMRRFWSSQEPR